MSSLLLPLALFLGWLQLIHHADSVNIKLVDAPHTNRYYGSTSVTKALSLRAPPANISGPAHLRLLAGECFKMRHKTYTYSVCPFHNVTQKEDSSVWNSFNGVLGIWREWIIEGDKFVGMHFTLGESCGKTDRETKIMFNCSTVTALDNVTEPSTCKYTLWLHTPLACFKGAMQIYHVMEPELINAWDTADLEYRYGDITRKGLERRRRAVLLEAGLYYNFTRDEEYLKEHTTVTDTPSHSVGIDHQQRDQLEQCNKRKQSLINQLHAAQQQMESILRLVQDKDPKLRADIDSHLFELHRNHSNTTLCNHNNTTFCNHGNMTQTGLIPGDTPITITTPIDSATPLNSHPNTDYEQLIINEDLNPDYH